MWETDTAAWPRAPLLDANARKVRVKYDPHDMSAVFVKLPAAGGHLRLP